MNNLSIYDGAMVAGAGEERTRADPHRAAVAWGVAAVLVVLAFIATVVALNSTVYSASGFVGSYLAALERKDAVAALDTPGVSYMDDAADDLLASAALGGLGDIRLVSDTGDGDGIHHVVYEVDLDGVEGRSEFEVEYTGTRFAFFSTWEFVSSPVSVLEITPRGEARFEVNGVPLEAVGGPSVATRFAVLTPGVFSISHESDLLEAAPESVRVLEAGAFVRASVTPQANAEFVELVQTQLNAELEECATQTVLQPTGCPFGETISNRIKGTPLWTIADYPDVEIIPGVIPGTWQVPETAGAAHLLVGVRSLFDGTLSAFDEDVPFTVSYLLSFDADGNVSIVGQ